MKYKDCIIIIESPNKVQKIKAITGAEVYATVGHFLELKDINVEENYQPVFDYSASKKASIFHYIQKCKDKKVYIATDPDREGYGIGYMFYQKIKNISKEVYRAEFHEITESGIEKGLQEAVLFGNTNFKYYEAFLGRRVSDMFIGYSLSPYISGKLNIKSLSAGRVQTPALSLIVNREEDIKAFNELPKALKTSYQLQAQTIIDNKEYVIKHMQENKEYQFDTLEEAKIEYEKIKDCTKAMLYKINTKESSLKPPKPFTTSTLLKTASKNLNISVKEVQDTAQKLFEAGLITYIRTDCEFISKEYLQEHQNFFEHLYPDIYAYREYTAGKNSQAEAHEAIRITHPHKLEDLRSICIKEKITQEKDIALYELIFLNTLQSQCKDAIFENTTLHFKIKMSDFKISFKNLIFEGFLKFSPKKSDTKQTLENMEHTKEIQHSFEKINLKTLQENDLFPLKAITIKEIEKSPPKRYVESEFIEVLEKKGIGRPSTYASYLPILTLREYINIESKKREITPTPKGASVIEFFRNDANEWILDIAFTKQMEEKLDLITQKQASYIDFMKEIHSKLICDISFGKKKEKSNKTIPPSAKQVEFVKAIAQKLGLTLPKDLEKDCYVAKNFIDKHIQTFNKAKKQNETSHNNAKK